jgi:hypothetical protein
LFKKAWIDKFWTPNDFILSINKLRFRLTLSTKTSFFQMNLFWFHGAIGYAFSTWINSQTLICITDILLLLVANEFESVCWGLTFVWMQTCIHEKNIRTVFQMCGFWGGQRDRATNQTVCDIVRFYKLTVSTIYSSQGWNTKYMQIP